VAIVKTGAKSRKTSYERPLIRSGLTTIDGEAINIVWPSGVACAAMPAPIVPDAPSRFSTTTCFPRLSVSFAAICRATMSAAVPEVNATMMRSGRSGNA
jgi:hypothetical protein